MVSKRPYPKPCLFVGSSRKDLKRFPAKVQNRIGYALNEVPEGGEPMAAKVLKGFGGRAVLELVDDFDSNTYRAVYTVRFCRCGVRAACVSEEGQEGHCHTLARHRAG